MYMRNFSDKLSKILGDQRVCMKTSNGHVKHVIHSAFVKKAQKTRTIKCLKFDSLPNFESIYSITHKIYFKSKFLKLRPFSIFGPL